MSNMLNAMTFSTQHIHKTDIARRLKPTAGDIKTLQYGSEFSINFGKL